MKEPNLKYHVENQAKSGIGVTEYCKVHNLSKSKWYTQKRKLDKEKSKKKFSPITIKEKAPSRLFKIEVSLAENGVVHFSGISNNPEGVLRIIEGSLD